MVRTRYCYGPIDVSPPASMHAGITDEDEDTECETELPDSGSVERFGVAEDRHNDGEW